MNTPMIQRLLEQIYKIEEVIITEGLFSVLGQDRRDMVMLAVGEIHLFTFRLKSVEIGTEFELDDMVELDKLVFSAHNQTMRLRVDGFLYYQYYQLCNKVNTHEIWENFTRALRQHGTEKQWIHEAMKFPKESSKGKITYLPSYVNFLNDVLKDANDRYIKIYMDRFKPTFGPGTNLRRCVSMSMIAPSVDVPDNYYTNIKHTEMEPTIKYGSYTLEDMKEVYWFQKDEKPVDPIIQYYTSNPTDHTYDKMNEIIPADTLNIKKATLEMHEPPAIHVDQDINLEHKTKTKKCGIMKKILKSVFPWFYKSKTKE